jgi:hypothetical protein
LCFISLIYIYKLINLFRNQTNQSPMNSSNSLPRNGHTSVSWKGCLSVHEKLILYSPNCLYLLVVIRRRSTETVAAVLDKYWGLLSDPTERKKVRDELRLREPGLSRRMFPQDWES